MLIRLDIAVHAKTPSLSRSFAQKLIRDGKVKVNNAPATKISLKVKKDDKISINYVETPIAKIDLPILYEDNDCVVIVKPEGILTHSKGAFNPEPTVASWLESKTKGFYENIGRIGIVHRLDRATSGVMICAKNPEALAYLQKQFSSRRAKKIYIAIIEGEIDPPEASINLPIERNLKQPQRFRVNSKGKSASTYYKAVDSFNFANKHFTKLHLEPKTGRTHQIRVHLNYLKKPILGDKFYGGLKADRLYLHAFSLEISLPNGELKKFESKLPTEFKEPNI